MSDRPFPFFRRGELREETLTYFRNGLRELVNPETNQPFTEDEIAIATAELTNWWAEANALDLVLLAIQSRGLWLSDQIWPDRASTDWLVNRHGKLREMEKLPATGGSGTATGVCLVGSTFTGSTTIPDDTADYATDPSGKRFQVLFTTVAGESPLRLTFKGVDTGRETNLAAGTKLRWQRAPLGAEDFTVDARFKGGSPVETDDEFAKRLLARINKRQGAGNRAEIRDLARAVDSGVEDAFIYSCAYSANSMHVALVGKRDPIGGPHGPLARIPGPGTVAVVAAALTPPGTDKIPGQVFVVTTAAVSQPLNVALQLDLAAGTDGGWTDPVPWPNPTVLVPAITSLTSQTIFSIQLDVGHTRPEATPAIMAWDVARSRWELLKVATAIDVGSGVFNITLVSAPTMTLAIGTYISPATKRLDDIAAAMELYIDSFGTGELVSDERRSRAYRWPIPSDERPQVFAASEAAGWLREFLGPALGTKGVAELAASAHSPTVPTLTQNGPAMFTLGKFAISPKP